MEKIGLGTEEDLYEKNILTRGGQLSKTEICHNLRHYIENAPKPKLENRVQTQVQVIPASQLSNIMEKVTRAVYYAINAGLIFVPVLIHPHAGATGFAIGFIFFVLKRFGAPGTQSIADISHEIMDSMIFGNILRRLLNRRIFSFSTGRRDEANQFAKNDFYWRMRTINWLILQSIFVSCFTLRVELPGMGSLFQGVALANEVVHLV